MERAQEKLQSIRENIKYELDQVLNVLSGLSIPDKEKIMAEINNFIKPVYEAGASSLESVQNALDSLGDYTTSFLRPLLQKQQPGALNDMDSAMENLQDQVNNVDYKREVESAEGSTSLVQASALNASKASTNATSINSFSSTSSEKSVRDMVSMYENKNQIIRESMSQAGDNEKQISSIRAARPDRSKIHIEKDPSKRTEMDEFNELCMKPFKEQAIAFLNAYWNECGDQADFIFEIAYDHIRKADMVSKKLKYL